MSNKNNKFILAGSLIIAAAVGIGTFFGFKFLHDKSLNKELFEINLSNEELEKRTNPEYLNTVKLLDENAPEYLKLAQGDKDALKHLVRAAMAIQEIQFELDNCDNAAFAEFLQSEIAKGNKTAEMTMRLFMAQRGMTAVDRESNYVMLAKNHPPVTGFYPADLSQEELHNILLQMLQKGEKDLVKKILNQRSVVDWSENGKGLIAVDYVDKFAKKFVYIADELELAAETSTNADFNEYLRLQANAFRKADPMLDAYADKKWASLQDTPLEFTVTRESYADSMTKSILSNPVLSKMLEDLGITPLPKDSLGCRVGIVNKESTEKLLKIKEFLPKLAELMPFKDQYVQNISQNDNKQTMVDVDLITMAGDCGAYRGGITIAENLPNDDKLSLSIGGGRRNVYHRQVRQSFANPDKVKRKISAILVPELHKYYNKEAGHWFTIGHENAHSLGPNSGTEKLGQYQSIIEENKADMASLAFIDFLTKEKMYTPEQRKQIIVTSVVDNFLKAKPKMTQAHRVRSIMQIHYMMQKGAVKVNDANLIEIDLDKAVLAANEMLKEIVEIQISGNVKKAEKFVNDNFVWDDKIEVIAEKLRATDKELNGETVAPLSVKLLTE